MRARGRMRGRMRVRVEIWVVGEGEITTSCRKRGVDLQ
jgi:hypothetical protein